MNDVVFLPSPIAVATLRHWKSTSPTPGSMYSLWIASGCRRGDLLDVDAALGARDHDDALRVAVDHQREVELALDPRGALDEHAAHALALGPGLRRDERGAEHLVGDLGDLGGGVADLHAAGLAAAARVDLGLHDPALAAELLGDARRGLRGVDDLAARRGHPVPAEQRLRLVLVDVHLCLLSRSPSAGPLVVEVSCAPVSGRASARPCASGSPPCGSTRRRSAGRRARPPPCPPSPPSSIACRMRSARSTSCLGRA